MNRSIKLHQETHTMLLPLCTFYTFVPVPEQIELEATSKHTLVGFFQCAEFQDL